MSYEPIITATLAAGSTESPYFYECNISQKLCCAACEDETPVFNPAFSVVGTSSLGSNQYVVTVHVEGLISYTLCKGNCCSTRSQLMSTNFTLPVYSATAPTSVSIAAGSATSIVDGAPCKKCSRNFVSEIPLTLTF